MEKPSMLFLFLISFVVFSLTEASVPPHQTFKHVIEGPFGDATQEYDATYRALPISAGPFQLCFYNTTPDAFTFALLMGTEKSGSIRRWVWEANRARPVRYKSWLQLLADGNLVLGDEDGSIAWQTNTADKGVVGFKLLENGNLVLYDSKGKFVWQSFDYPVDTLLVGSSLRLGVTTKLVSRASEVENSNGPFSLVLENNTINMYYKSPNAPKPVLYWSFRDWIRDAKLDHVTFASNFSLNYGGGSIMLKKPRVNGTLSYLRLEMDGNVRIHTFDEEADWGAWDESFTMFDRSSLVSECQLPSRCGNFGLCEKDQCVGCPTPKGALAWSENCRSPKLSSCDAKDFKYFKLEGVDHFTTKYNAGEGPVKVDECGKRCTRDCKCLGYFYNTQFSRCWLSYDLKTVTKVDDSAYVAYIKAPTTSSRRKFHLLDM